MTNQNKAIEAITEQDWAVEMIAAQKRASRLPHNREQAVEDSKYTYPDLDRGDTSDEPREDTWEADGYER